MNATTRTRLEADRVAAIRRYAPVEPKAPRLERLKHLVEAIGIGFVVGTIIGSFRSH